MCNILGQQKSIVKSQLVEEALGHWAVWVWYMGSVGYGVSPVSTGRIYSSRHPSWAWPRQNQSSLPVLCPSSAPITWLMNHSSSLQFVEFKTVEIWITNDYSSFHNSPDVRICMFLVYYATTKTNLISIFSASHKRRTRTVQRDVLLY
jgi:hypothetical protein